MPTPPTYTDAFNHVGGDDTTVWKTWAKLRSVLLTDETPLPDVGQSCVYYQTGLIPNSGSLIRSELTLTTFYTGPSLTIISEPGGLYYLKGANVEDTAKDYIIGHLAVFNSGDDDTVTTDAFDTEQSLPVTVDPEFVYSLSGWTRVS
jgi:hypothetical protein